MKQFSNLLTAEEILKCFSEIIFINQELQQQHNPYDQEIREMQAIENGDLEQLENSLAEQYTGQLGRLARNDLRHLKNLGIVVATLCSRAALKGGLLPEVAYTLCDAYINKFEEIDNVKELQQIIFHCKYHYCKLVANANEEKSQRKKNLPHSKINQCKNYIFAHLHGKIKVQDIAEALETTPSYLADLFRNYEGQTISAFILHEKIKLVKNMLIYSPYTYSQIANYLGFASQSHLGAQFKKETGYTLRQYREEFKIQT